MIRIFALLLLGGWPLFCQGQIADTMDYAVRLEKAVQQIQDLRSGTLVVRLNTGHAKISAMERSLANPKLSKRRRARLEGLIAIEKEDRKLRNEAMVRSFHSFYTFSDFVVVADTSLSQLQAGVRQGIFLDEDLELDTSLVLKSGPFLIAGIGYTRAEDGSSVADALIIHDAQYNQLESPFPYYSDLATVGVVGLKAIKKEENAIQKHMDHLVKRVNTKVGRFYQRKAGEE
jgi:hypothetical protein